jgi:hypothetical protein
MTIGRWIAFMLGSNPFVNGMAIMRIVAGSIEICAAFLMLRYYTVEHALRINAFLGLVGPIMLITVTLIGVSGLAARVSFKSIMLVFMGVYLIILGTQG